MIPDFCSACGRRTDSTLFCASLDCSLSLGKNKEALLAKCLDRDDTGMHSSLALTALIADVKLARFDAMIAGFVLGCIYVAVVRKLWGRS